MDLGIAGKRAAVAGGSSGLGLGIATALVEAGVKVAIGGRDPSKVDLAATGIGAVPIVGDVRGIKGGQAFADAAVEALGGVDILIPNAGGPPGGDFSHTDINAYTAAFELNCLSAIAMCDRLVPAMREQRWGRIAAITSIAVREPMANLILSNTARAALTAFLKTLSREVAPHGITVNTLQPGLHRTKRVTQLYGKEADAKAEGIAVGFFGDPDDFGRVGAFICSESAKFITGASIPVDGGTAGGLQ